MSVLSNVAGPGAGAGLVRPGDTPAEVPPRPRPAQTLAQATTLPMPTGADGAWLRGFLDAARTGGPAALNFLRGSGKAVVGALKNPYTLAAVAGFTAGYRYGWDNATQIRLLKVQLQQIVSDPTLSEAQKAREITTALARYLGPKPQVPATGNDGDKAAAQARVRPLAQSIQLLEQDIRKLEQLDKHPGADVGEVLAAKKTQLARLRQDLAALQPPTGDPAAPRATTPVASATTPPPERAWQPPPTSLQRPPVQAAPVRSGTPNAALRQLAATEKSQFAQELARLSDIARRNNESWVTERTSGGVEPARAALARIEQALSAPTWGNIYAHHRFADGSTPAQARDRRFEQLSVGGELVTRGDLMQRRQGLQAFIAAQPKPAAPLAPTGTAHTSAQQTVGHLDLQTGVLSSAPGASTVPVRAQWSDALPVGGQRFSAQVDPEHGNVRPPGDPNAIPVEGALVRNADGSVSLHALRPRGGPAPGGPGPDWGGKVLAALATTIFAGASIAASTVLFKHESAEQNRVGTLQPAFKDAHAAAQKTLSSIGPNSTPEELRNAREAIWRSHFEAANTTLEGARWNRLLNIPGLGGGEMFDRADLQSIRAAQADFLNNLRTQPLPTPNEREIGVGRFDTTPQLEGDALKLLHVNAVMQKVNVAAQQQVVQIAGRSVGDPAVAAFVPRPFDVKAYVAQHAAALNGKEGRHAAFIALWRHHLDQVLPALGSTRVTASEARAFNATVAQWLKSPLLNSSRLVLLPGNAAAQPVLQSAIAAAENDADSLVNAMPKAPSLADRLQQQQQQQQTPLQQQAPTPTPTPSVPLPTQPAASATPLATTGTSGSQAALEAVNTLVDQAQLAGAAAPATSLDRIRFDVGMFLPPDGPQDTQAIDAARQRATTLFNAIKAVGLQNPSLNAEFTQLLTRFNADVLIPLSTMTPATTPPRQE